MGKLAGSVAKGSFKLFALQWLFPPRILAMVYEITKGWPPVYHPSSGSSHPNLHPTSTILQQPLI